MTYKDPIADLLVQRHGLKRRDATRIAFAGTTIDLDEGEVLCRKGDHGLEAFLIVAGSATVFADDGPVTLGPGDVFGELAVLDVHRVRNATVATAEPSRVLVFDVRTFRGLADEPQFADILAPQRAAA